MERQREREEQFGEGVELEANVNQEISAFVLVTQLSCC